LDFRARRVVRRVTQIDSRAFEVGFARFSLLGLVKARAPHWALVHAKFDRFQDVRASPRFNRSLGGALLGCGGRGQLCADLLLFRLALIFPVRLCREFLGAWGSARTTALVLRRLFAMKRSRGRSGFDFFTGFRSMITNVISISPRSD
jgi:hypothetical protein